MFLIGPTGIGMSSIPLSSETLISILLGKTSFALSLPGIPNHCHGYWTTDMWYDEADYMIVDDVPWNEFEKRGFPNPQDLITGQKFLSVCN